jgi:hypothetical protein
MGQAVRPLHLGEADGGVVEKEAGVLVLSRPPWTGRCRHPVLQGTPRTNIITARDRPAETASFLERGERGDEVVGKDQQTYFLKGYSLVYVRV